MDVRYGDRKREPSSTAKSPSKGKQKKRPPKTSGESKISQGTGKKKAGDVPEIVAWDRRWGPVWLCPYCSVNKAFF